jgi:ZIP family zinc transporter
VSALVDFFRTADPVTQSVIATFGTYLLTAVGTLPVLMFRTAPRRLMDAMMGFAAGVMTAASCWSLLVPAIDLGGVSPAVVGLVLGGGFIYAADQLLPHLHGEFPDEATAEGPQVAWQRSTLLMLAMTLHNFPEGLAVGVRFGGGDLGAATALAIGIGLQNVPEGFAVAISLLSIGYAPRTAFWVAMLTGLVEPVGGAIGAAAVSLAEPLMPAILGVAAGAMLFVISDEIIPETHRRGYETVATFSLLGGFAVMMVLDTVFA